MTNAQGDFRTLYAILMAEAYFDRFNNEVSALSQFTTDLEIGLASLAARKLPPQLFPSQVLCKVLANVVAEVPAGWSFSITDERPTEPWKFYRKAAVTTAF